MNDAPRTGATTRRIVSLLMVLVTALAAGLAGASPAAAAPATGKVDVDKWPKELRWALPNTEEFYGKYMFKETDQPCSKEDGGNAYRYVMDYLDHTGEVFQMISHTSGTSVLAITDIGGARTDLPALSTVDFTLSDGTKMPPLMLPFVPDSPQTITGKSLCGKDFAQFGVSDLQSPFGFTYYSEPDAGSVGFIDKAVKSFGAEYAGYWAKRYGKGFDARNLDSYCAQDNPFCLTGSFLHCDQRTGDAPDPSAVSWCQTWNYRVAMYNVRLMEAVRFYGTKSFDSAGNPTGSLKPLDTASNAVRTTPDPLGAPTTDPAVIGRDGYLARWAAAMAIPDYISYLRGLGKALTIGTAVALGAAAGIAAFWLGAGLLTSLLIGGAVAAFTVFDGTSCASDLSKCLAEAAADGMSFALSSVPDAAAATAVPSMSTSTWKRTFTDIATVSVGLLMILFIMNLIMSLVVGKPVLVFRSMLGVFGYFIMLSAGGTFLSLLILARNSATQKISGGPGFINELTNRMVDAINKLGADTNFGGWLLVFVLCLVSMICGFIVLCILYLSNAWIPLVVCILILQLAGWAAPGLSASKWFHRGTGILWSILLMAPAITLLWRVGMSMLTNTTEIATLAIGTITLLASALVPGVVAGLFSLGVSGKLGIGAATLGAGLAALGAGKAFAGLAGGASMQPGKTPEQMTDDQLAYSRGIGGGSGALSGIASKISPAASFAGAAGSAMGDAEGAAGGGGSDPWALTGTSGSRGKHSAGEGRGKISAVPNGSSSSLTNSGTSDGMAAGESSADDGAGGVELANAQPGQNRSSTDPGATLDGMAAGESSADDGAGGVELANAQPGQNRSSTDPGATLDGMAAGESSADGAAGVELANAQPGQNRSGTSSDAMLDGATAGENSSAPSSGEMPMVSSGPGEAPAAAQGGERSAATPGLPLLAGNDGVAPSEGPAGGPTASPANGTVSPAVPGGTVDGAAPLVDRGVGQGQDRPRSGGRTPPSIATGPGPAPGLPAPAPGAPRPGTHGFSSSGPLPSGAVPTGSIAGTSPGGSTSGGSPPAPSGVGHGEPPASSPGGSPSASPGGVPWAVPLDESTPADPEQTAPGSSPALPPWHEKDLPWNELPAKPTSDTDSDGGASS